MLNISNILIRTPSVGLQETFYAREYPEHIHFVFSFAWMSTCALIKKHIFDGS